MDRGLEFAKAGGAGGRAVKESMNWKVEYDVRVCNTCIPGWAILSNYDYSYTSYYRYRS